MMVFSHTLNAFNYCARSMSTLTKLIEGLRCFFSTSSFKKSLIIDDRTVCDFTACFLDETKQVKFNCFNINAFISANSA